MGDMDYENYRSGRHALQKRQNISPLQGIKPSKAIITQIFAVFNAVNNCREKWTLYIINANHTEDMTVT
jgi:hypothetical protein